jgi:hypothetical protein
MGIQGKNKMKIKYLSLVIVSLGLIGCGQNTESNFTVVCENSIMNNHISFDFKNNNVSIRGFPKQFYLEAIRQTRDWADDNGEQKLEYPMVEYTDSFIKFGSESMVMSETIRINNTFDRSTMTRTTTTGWYEKDGTLADKTISGLPNPLTVSEQCIKPVT